MIVENVHKRLATILRDWSYYQDDHDRGPATPRRIIWATALRSPPRIDQGAEFGDAQWFGGGLVVLFVRIGR